MVNHNSQEAKNDADLDWLNPMRVLIAGGGTGGHVIPALAIARELKTRYQADVLFVGTARGIENRLVPQAGFGLMKIKVGALKNVSLLTRLRTLVGLPLAIIEARKIINVFAPDVVVGVGGYASGPAMAAYTLWSWGSILLRAPRPGCGVLGPSVHDPAAAPPGR